MDRRRVKRILGYIREGNWRPFYTFFMFAILKALTRLHNKAFDKRNAIMVMEEDWDYLIVLDACRYDFFKEAVGKEVNYVISGGSMTEEWLEWNFGGHFKDVIYIAGNPYFASVRLIETFGFNPFFKVEEVWDYGWDESVKTIPPQQVTRAALNTLSKFPEKRLIIHYMQPHRPFFTNKRFLEAEGHRSQRHTGEAITRDRAKNIRTGAHELVWGGTGLEWRAQELVWRGDASVEEYREAYMENLRLVMEEVDKLQENLAGRVVVTADHGEFLGELQLLGHHRGVRAKELVKVPWYVLKDDRVDGNEAVKRQIIDRKLVAEKDKVRDRITKLKESGKL